MSGNPIIYINDNVIFEQNTYTEKNSEIGENLFIEGGIAIDGDLNCKNINTNGLLAAYNGIYSSQDIYIKSEVLPNNKAILLSNDGSINCEELFFNDNINITKNSSSEKSIIINGSTNTISTPNIGLYVSPIRGVTVHSTNNILYYNNNSSEITQGNIINGLGEGNILVSDNNSDVLISSILSTTNNQININCNIIPTSDNIFSIGSISNRIKDIYVGQGSVILGPAQISSDDNGIAYSQYGFATPFINIGPTIGIPKAVGGWHISATGTALTPSFDLIAQENTVDGVTGPIYSLLNKTPGPIGPTGPTGPIGPTGQSGITISGLGEGSVLVTDNNSDVLVSKQITTTPTQVLIYNT